MPDVNDDATRNQVAALTGQQLRSEVSGLYTFGDKLDLFLAGDLSAWTDDDALALHQLAVRVQSATAIIRDWSTSDARNAALIYLDRPRQRP